MSLTTVQFSFRSSELCFSASKRLQISLILALRLAWWYFVLVFSSPLRTAVISLGEERANLRAFFVFVRFVLVLFVCFLFLLVSGKGRGL